MKSATASHRSRSAPHFWTPQLNRLPPLKITPRSPAAPGFSAIAANGTAAEDSTTLRMLAMRCVQCSMAASEASRTATQASCVERDAAGTARPPPADDEARRAVRRWFPGLRYEARSSDGTVATASVADGVLTVHIVGEGVATITLVAIGENGTSQRSAWTSSAAPNRKRSCAAGAGRSRRMARCRKGRLDTRKTSRDRAAFGLNGVRSRS